VLGQEAHLVWRETASGVQQVRPELERAPECRSAAPLLDPTMIAPAQDLGNLPAPEHGRPCVLRVLQEPGREALVAP